MMGLKSTRKILSVIFAVIIAFSFAGAVTGLVLNLTFATQSYLEKLVDNGKVVSACEEQLEGKYKALSAECGIPERVFLAVKTDYPVDSLLKNAYNNIYSDGNLTLYNETLVDYFEELCKQYLKGNELKYNKENVRRVCEKAALIYSNTVGLHEVDTLFDSIIASRELSIKTMSVSACFLVVSVIILTVLYDDTRKGFIYALSGIGGGSLGACLGSLLCLIINPLRNFTVAPEAYLSSLEDMVRFAFLVIAALSLIISVASFFALRYLNRIVERSKDKVAV